MRLLAHFVYVHWHLTLVALFLGRGVLTRRGIFGLYDGRYLRTFLSLNPGRCLWSFASFNIASLCDNLSTMVRRLYIWGISWYALTTWEYNFWNSDERSSYVLVLYSSSVNAGPDVVIGILAPPQLQQPVLCIFYKYGLYSRCFCQCLSSLGLSNYNDVPHDKLYTLYEDQSDF